MTLPASFCVFSVLGIFHTENLSFVKTHLSSSITLIGQRVNTIICYSTTELYFIMSYSQSHSVLYVAHSSVTSTLLYTRHTVRTIFPFIQRPSPLSSRPDSAWTSRLTFRSCRRSPSSGECVCLDWHNIKLIPELFGTSVNQEIWALIQPPPFTFIFLLRFWRVNFYSMKLHADLFDAKILK